VGVPGAQGVVTGTATTGIVVTGIIHKLVQMVSYGQKSREIFIFIPAIIKNIVILAGLLL
jgi:hypothetical protein